MERKFHIKIWVCIFFFGVVLNNLYGSEIVYYLEEGDGEQPLVNYVNVFHSSSDLPVSEVNDSLIELSKTQTITSTNFGFSTHYFWLKVNICNPYPIFKDMVVVIRNPHIDFAKAWTQSENDAWNLVYIGGDGMPFYHRSVHNRNIIIPLRLEGLEKVSLMVQVDKRNASVSVPISIMSQSSFEQEENKGLFAFGVYFGVLLLIIVFALFVYYLLQQKIFLWYAVYLIFLGLYLLAHVGLLFQIAYPNLFWINDYSRPVFITFSSAALIHFVRLLLNIPKLLPQWNWVYDALIYVLLGITFYWVATPWWHDQQTILYLNVQNFTLLLSLLVVLTTSVLTFSQQRVVVAFFWVAFLAVLAAGMSIILVESGLINERFIAVNPLFIGSLIEVIVFAVGLSYWSRVNDAERIKLLGVVENAKKMQVDSYIKGIETEKSKIAADLHDDIGSRLSHLKRQVERESPDQKELISSLTQVTQKVRTLSHGLASPRFESSDFIISLKHLVQTHQTNETTINLQLFDLPDEIDTQITKQLYRVIQSSLSSIERHAKASLVEIQFFFHQNELVLAIEDDGVGFTFNKNNPGLTMKDVLSRVELINGEIEISSSKKYGTSVMINVPISNNQ